MMRREEFQSLDRKRLVRPHHDAAEEFQSLDRKRLKLRKEPTYIIFHYSHMSFNNQIPPGDHL